jgi:quinol monooxygenase YgiN
MNITLFATLSVKPGKIVTAKNELHKILESSRSEPGCLRYEIYQAEQDENSVHLIETYVDRDALATHSQSDYFKNFVKKVSPLLEKEFSIQYITILK